MIHYLHHRLRHHKMTLPSKPWADNIIIVGATTTTTTTVETATTSTPSSVLSKAHVAMTPPPQGGESSVVLDHFFAVWGVVVVLMALSLLTLVSNSTILTMFVLRKSLRRCKNIYIASLAAADLGIGLTLPLAALEQVEGQWALQGVACHLYQTVRCSLLYVSLLSILLITMDRWWSIHFPFTYRVHQSKRLAAVAVAVVWLVGFFLHVPPVLLWDYVIGTDYDMVGDVRSARGESPVRLEVLKSAVEGGVSSSLSSSPFLSTSLPPARLLPLPTTLGPVSVSPDLPSPFYLASGSDSDHLQISRLLRTGSGEEEREGVRRRCELPYDQHFSFVLTVSVVLYFFPLLALWGLNCSLYVKITRRKSIKIRRSLSVHDNHFLTFRKSSSESESSPNNNNGAGDSDSIEIRSAEHRQRLLAAARAGRRHTLALPGQPMARTGAGAVYYPSQTRPPQARRVSLQDAFSGMGSVAALAGVGSNLPRVTSCGRFPSNMGSGTSGSLVPLGLWFGTGHRHSTFSTSRKQSDDLVKELLGRQDKRAARLLGLLVTVFTLCWLPHTVVAVLRSSDPRSVAGWVRDAVFWVLVTNSAINPFLYGLLNAEFRKILRGWFYFRRRSTFRLKHALLYWSLPHQGDLDVQKESPVAHGLCAAPIKE